MVDNVNIENVGGTRPNLGVASEATLQALLDSTNRNNRDGTGNQQSQRLQDLYNRSTRDGARNQGTLSKAVNSTTKATYNFSKELLAGGDRMSDFSDSVFGASSKLSRLIRFGERYVDTLRDLTSVGASFNNSMFDMIAASASSSMNMDDFAQMVRMNSQTLATFGAGVTNGAKVFGSFSRDFRSGVGKSLFGMGFTINDINDGLMSFLDIERRRSSQDLRTGRAQQNSAYEYIKSLDLLTKITGKQRKEIENAMQTQIQDAGIRSQINRLDGDARRNLQQTLAFLDTEMGPIGDGLKDLMDGVAQTDLGKALANQIPGITAFAQRMFAGGASLETVIDQLGNNFGPQLEKMAAGYSKAQLDQMRSAGGVTGAIAELLDNTYRLNQQRDKDVAAMREEQKQRDRLTSVFGGFEQAVINLRKSLYDAFFKLGESTGIFDAFEELGNTLSSLFTVDTGLNRLLPNLTNSLTGVFSWFAQNIRDFTAWIKEGKFQKYLDSLGEKVTATKEYFSDLIERMKTEGIWKTIKTELLKGFSNFTTSMSEFWNGPTMTKLSNDISNWFKDLLFGKEIDVDPRTGPDEIRLERQGGLIKAITDGFSGLFSDDSVLSSLKNGISNILFGKEVENFEGPELIKKRQGGLFESISTGFKNMLSGNSSIVDAITGSFENIFNMAKNALYNVIGVEGGGKGSLSKWFDDTWKIVQTKFDNIIERIESTIESVKTAIGFGNGKSLTQWFDETWASVKSTMESISTNISSAIELIKQAFGLGEGGSLGKWIDEQIAKFTKFVDDQRATSSKWIDEQVTTLENKLKDFLGMTAGQTFESYITDMIDTLTTTIIDIIENRIPALIEAAIQGARSALGGGTATAESIAAGETGLGTLADQGALTGAYQGLLGFGDIDRERFLAEAEGGIVEGLNRMFGNMLGLGMEDWLEQKLTTLNAADIRGDQAREEVMRGFQSYIDQNYTGDERETMQRYLDTTIRETLDGIEGYRQGTNGFKNFGGGTFAKLHGAEAVVPRNTPAGELLQMFYELQNKTSPSIDTPEQIATPRIETGNVNQTTLINKIEELNSTMIRVAALLENSIGVQTKTMRGVKGLTTDYYRGINR